MLPYLAACAHRKWQAKWQWINNLFNKEKTRTEKNKIVKKSRKPKQSHRMKKSKINWNEYFAVADKTIYIQMAGESCVCVCEGL